MQADVALLLDGLEETRRSAVDPRRTLSLAGTGSNCAFWSVFDARAELAAVAARPTETSLGAAASRSFMGEHPNLFASTVS
jgi:hypothetical protein